MSITNRIVSHIPLIEIWKGNTILQAKRNKYLTKEQIINLLKEDALEFVVAEVGLTLEWINKLECFKFWKMYAKDHIADNNEKIDYNSFPENYAFIASQWMTNQQDTIIVLEKIH